MQILRKKEKTIAVIIAMLLVVSIMMIAIPVQAQSSEAHGGTPQLPFTGGPVPAGVTPSTTITTIPYLSFSPNPIGVGQALLVNIWVQPATHVARAHTGYTVNITTPNGVVDKIGPMVSYQGDTTAWFTYVPVAIGEYKLQFFFAGDYYPAGYYVNGLVNGTLGQYSAAAPFNATKDVYYEPSQTAVYTLTVQQDQVASWPPVALPTDYWTRPISPENRDWWVIAGNNPNSQIGGGAGSPGWPDNTNVYASNYNFIPYVTGPTSAHIVWRRQGALGGLFGGLIDGAYTPYQAPNREYDNVKTTFNQAGPGISGNPNILYQGRLYQSIQKPFNGKTQNVWECTDIRTGEVIWDLTDITQVPTLISYAEDTPPVPGALARTDRTNAALVYIGPSNVANIGLVVKYDPMTGAVLLNQTIPVRAGTVYADPNVLSIQTLGSGANTQYRLINWTLQGLGSNFTANIISNVTYPFASIGTADYESMIAVSTLGAINPATGIASDVWIRAASLTTGQLLWNVSADIGYPIFTGSALVADHGKAALRFDDGYYYTWDLKTGSKLWKSELSSYPWGTFGAYAVQSAYGLIFYEQYDGVVAYDWNNGKIVWMFQAPALPFETPYTNGTGNANGEVYSFFSGGIVANGILYAASAEHSPTAPLTRGWKVFAINATTGKEIWNSTGAFAPGLIADGYMTASNFYDGYLYVFGKGKTSTTISTPLTQIVSGESAVITGTVLDQSPAQPGTPAVSKDSMSEWMAYLHMQHQMPANVIGVPLSIDVVDPNNNFVHIATVTSDESGTFGYVWKPTVVGLYKITATFMGDDSYGSSWAQTFATVVAAPTQTSPTTQPPTPDYTMTVIGAAIAIIIVVIIAVAVAVLILRRRA